MSTNACRLGYSTIATASHSCPGSATSAVPPSPTKTQLEADALPDVVDRLDVLEVALAPAVGLEAQQVEHRHRPAGVLLEVPVQLL